MNSPLLNNNIYTNLPSFNDIKNWKISNINYIEWKDSYKNESIVVRMKMWKEKPKHTTLVLKDYIIDWIVNETQLILDSVRLKENYLNEKESKNSIVNKKWRINWLSVKVKRWRIVFSLALINGVNKKFTTKWIKNTEDFDQKYYETIWLYIETREELWFKKLSNKEIIKISSSVEYYRNKYTEKLKEKILEEEKTKLISNRLVSETGIILLINNNWTIISYKSNIGDKIISRTIGLKTEYEIINELITTFVLQNWYEMWGDIHNWLKEKLKNYSSYFIQKEKNKEQKNSKVW